MTRATNVRREEVHYHRIELDIEDAPVVEHWNGFSHHSKPVKIVRATVQWEHNCWPTLVSVSGQVLRKDGEVGKQWADGVYTLPDPTGAPHRSSWRELGEAPAWLARLLYSEGAPIALSLVRGWDPSLREPEGGAS